MMRRLGYALLAAATLAGGSAHAAAASTPVTVIMPAEIEKGADPARAIAAMKEIAGYVHGQPGLISDDLLVADFQGAPKYIHVMKWKSLADWTALAASQRFQTLLGKDLAYVKIGLAQPYRVVN